MQHFEGHEILDPFALDKGLKLKFWYLQFSVLRKLSPRWNLVSGSLCENWDREINGKISTDLNNNIYTGCLKSENIYLQNEEHNLEDLLRPLY